ncbi:MAG: DNA repair protein RadC [Bacteroidales bacterium]|nr:DNA repair protein RadC [Bacteroidales bacterium]
MKIKDLSAAERPREKMLSRGAGSLSDGELLAVLIGSGTRSESALDLARRLLGLADGQLGTLFNLSPDKLLSQPGIGPGKAACIIAAFELGRRFLQEEASLVRKPLLTARQVYDLLIPRLKGLSYEECWILLLNGRNYLAGKLLVSRGGPDSTVIDTRRIVRHALDKGASSLVLVHNHPSGNPRPGPSDIRQTEALRKGVGALGLTLLDHVVVADDAFFSFADDRMYLATGGTVE